MADRPQFHLAPAASWLNDPNGPLLYKGVYHIFYQYIADNIKWTWGLAWGHSRSTDLVRWERLPVALEPTPGGFDQDGCFSGCATTDTDGTPAILYTGVVRKPDAPALVPSSVTVTKMCTERQLLARAANPDDADLVSWVKAHEPWLSSPPAGPPSGPVGCWRDPCIIQRPSSSNHGRWRVILGSGVGDPVDAPEAALGTVLVYSSEKLESGWVFEGELCRAQTPEQGLVWECPVLCELPRLCTESSTGIHLGHGRGHHQGHDSRDAFTHGQEAVAPPDADSSSKAEHGTQHTEGQATHLFSVSAGRSPALYWLGRYDASGCSFDIGAEDAVGPLPLDYGDLLYAPNLIQDAKGRVIMWGWLSELPDAGSTRDYAGALSVPRMLSLHEGRLHQQPLPELVQLRKENGWRTKQATVTHSTPMPLAPGTATAYADVEVTLQPDTDAHSAGLLIGPATGPSTTATLQAATLTYSFESCTLTMTVGAAGDIMGMHLDSAAQGRGTGVTGSSTRRTMGDVLEGMAPGEALTLRVLLDYSLVEVFASSGQALATRVYRCSSSTKQGGTVDDGMAADHVGLWLFANGGDVIAHDVAVHGMGSIHSTA